MTMYRLFPLCWVLFVVSTVLTASAAIIVYDGVPVLSGGVGAYNGISARLVGQDPTHVSIIGETNKWKDATSSGTGTIVVSSDGLSYPLGNFLPTQPGAIMMTHTATTSASGVPRSAWRELEVPLIERSFYFSVLMAYNDLSAYKDGNYAAWGLTQVATNGSSYPAGDGICVGFQKTASGVDAILRVLDTFYVIQADVELGTYQFVGRFDYNASGADTVSASLSPGRTEPGVWDVSATEDVLDSSQSLNYVNLGFAYAIGGNWVMADEWCVGESYADVCGVLSATPFVESTSPTNVTLTSAWMTGVVTSTGTATSVASIYYGTTDGATVAEDWEHVYCFPGVVVSEPQEFSFQATGLIPSNPYYYRFAASNENGQVFSPETSSFKSISPGVSVYDCFPVFGIGSYLNVALENQDPTHPFIIGGINAWKGPKTSVISIDSSGLSYPDSIALKSLGGAIKMSHSEKSHDMSSSFTRSLSRELVTPIAETSFYFSVLLEYKGLDYWQGEKYFTMGLTRSSALDSSSPPADGVLFGFQRSLNGVDAILRVAGQVYVVESNVAAQTTCFLVGKFVYNPDGPDTVSASLVTKNADPSNWAATVIADVLEPGQSLKWLSVGGYYNLNSNWIKADEWLTGKTFSDVTGISQHRTVITIR